MPVYVADEALLQIRDELDRQEEERVAADHLGPIAGGRAA
jgi:hypothetical protein